MCILKINRIPYRFLSLSHSFIGKVAFAMVGPTSGKGYPGIEVVVRIPCCSEGATERG